jgi:glycosyltransferase involved in cell wall biosynthesis
LKTEAPSPKGLRILAFNHKDVKNPGAGGGTWDFFRLLAHLVRNGHQVTVISASFDSAPAREVMDGVEVIRVGGGQLSFMARAALKYMTTSSLRKYDVVLDSALYGVPVFAKLYTRKPTASVVWHLPKHTFGIELRRTHGVIYGSILAWIARFLEDRLGPWLYRDVPFFTFFDSARKEMRELGYKHLIPVDDGMIASVIFGSLGNISDEDKLRLQAATPKRSGPPSLVVMGRLRKYKGVQDAIRAMTILEEQFPEAKLHILGQGDYEEDLHKLVADLGLQDRCIFHGYVPVEEKTRMIREAHILIMPSYKEGFATPVFEAGLACTPSVATDAVGVADSVEDGVSGLIYPMADHKKLAEAVARLLKDEDLRQRMGQKARERAQLLEKMYSQESSFVSEVEATLYGLLGRAPAVAERQPVTK